MHVYCCRAEQGGRQERLWCHVGWSRTSKVSANTAAPVVPVVYRIQQYHNNSPQQLPATAVATVVAVAVATLSYMMRTRTAEQTCVGRLPAYGVLQSAVRLGYRARVQLPFCVYIYGYNAYGLSAALTVPGRKHGRR